jgi:hypothetical protein
MQQLECVKLQMPVCLNNLDNTLKNFTNMDHLQSSAEV